MITYDYDGITGCISVLTQTENGNHREALIPGQFERAREILPDDLYAEVEALWTTEVVEAWEKQVAEEGI